MFSTAKCDDVRCETESPEDSENFAKNNLSKENVPSDEVASAVAAVSDEIGDILKDELGDADRAERIGAELADLSAELGMLAGLADVDQLMDSRLSLFDATMGNHRSFSDDTSSSTSSSSTWSGGRGVRGEKAKRLIRSQRTNRRRPIAKGKEMSRRRGAAARRAASVRAQRVGLASDASDVGADSDSDDQWTELSDTCSSDSVSTKEVKADDVNCDSYQHEGVMEAPAMGQFLLPLLSSEGAMPDPDHFHIRHEDILQLLASAEESVQKCKDGLNSNELVTEPVNQISSSSEATFEEPAITSEEEAALLKYVCETEQLEMEDVFTPVEEWLMGIYHSWCDISTLNYALMGYKAGTESSEQGEWMYRARFGCHCRLCLTLAACGPALDRFLRELVRALAYNGSTLNDAMIIMRTLGLKPACQLTHRDWNLNRLRCYRFSNETFSILQQQLNKLCMKNEISNQIVRKTCLCREYTRNFDKHSSLDRLCKILEYYKAASTISFEVTEGGGGAGAAGGAWWVEAAGRRLARYLAALRGAAAARLQPPELNAWSGYTHRCDCLTPRTLCAQQRNRWLRVSFFGLMLAVNEFNSSKLETAPECEKLPNGTRREGDAEDLQQGDGTGAKPPDSIQDNTMSEGTNVIANETVAVKEAVAVKETVAETVAVVGGEAAQDNDRNMSDSNATVDLDEMSESDGDSTNSESLGLSTSSSLDSTSELLVAAAAAAGSSSSEGGGGGGDMCRTVRHLMRSIASIERLMDRVLRHCDEWPDHEDARKRLDMGLSEVDRKLMAMYRRLPEVHRRQLHVYRKQKRLSTVCMRLVGGAAPPPPPPPGSPPATPTHADCRALCPEYHLHRFREVRRKVTNMRDQQLYYHRLRMWLEEQLRHERSSLADKNVTIVEDLSRRKCTSTKVPRHSNAAKRKLKPIPASISKPQRILQLLKNKAATRNTEKRSIFKSGNEEAKTEVQPPDAFPLAEKEDNVSDTETIVGEKESVDMKECIAKFAKFALNKSNDCEDAKYPESVSPPLQEVSPTKREQPFAPKPGQRLLGVNSFLSRSNFDEENKSDAAQIAPEVLNAPLNARKTCSAKEEVKPIKALVNVIPEGDESNKDPNMFKYVTFGLEIKKAIEECQNILNSYEFQNISNDKKDDSKESDVVSSNQTPPISEEMCDFMQSIIKGSAEVLGRMDPNDPNNANLTDLIGNMQVLDNIPELASKLYDRFTDAAFGLPKIASIINNLPEVNNEAQLTPETLKQIRELKSNKLRDSVKVTKNTAKRKTSRKLKSSVDSDMVGTVTFELDSKDITDFLKDEKELQTIMKNKSVDIKDILFSVSAQMVINKMFEYLKQNKNPELVKCLEVKDLFVPPKNCVNSESYTKTLTLFDNSVKDALTMKELRELVKLRFNSWKLDVFAKCKFLPVDMVESEIERMLEKFYSYIQESAEKQCATDSDKTMQKIEEIRRNPDKIPTGFDGSRWSLEILKAMTTLLNKTTTSNAFELFIMNFPVMSQENKDAVKSLNFRYMDVVTRCIDSHPLISWILTDPERAICVIREVTSMPPRKVENLPDFNSIPCNLKKEYFLEHLKETNKAFMQMLPKKALTGDEWLVMLYRLECVEDQMKEKLSKYNPPPTLPAKQQSPSEAEKLAGKGLSKIISKANVRPIKKTNQPEPPKMPVKKEVEKKEECHEDETENECPESHCRNTALLAKCEAILISKGDKTLLDSFYMIKSYITQGLPVPEAYKKHVISICSNIDARLLAEDESHAHCNADTCVEQDIKECDSEKLTQNPELLGKCSAQALRNAKQTLNAVAFRNVARNGQTKSESDACDTPKSDCKWTNDCSCANCKKLDASECLGDVVKQCYEIEKSKGGPDERRKEGRAAPKPSAKAPKPQQKACENGGHQQHVCRGESNTAEQPCTCCYCTVFGHAPTITTPVPRNFNETRERLRLILNKKKQRSKPAEQGAQACQDKKQVTAQTQTAEPPKVRQPPQPVTKPPALAPPSLTLVQIQAQQRRQAAAVAQQRRQAIAAAHTELAGRLATMSVADGTPPKPKAMSLQQTTTVHLNVPPVIKVKGRVNPDALEQIRLQQLKQQQQQQQQQPQPPPQQPQQPAAQKMAEAGQQQAAVKQTNGQATRQPRLLQRLESLSTRGSSCGSTSSNCSDECSWRGGGGACVGCGGCGARPEDPRDLDALLQYIEGPARHVDRGKKRAKKQRQKAKRLEARLLEERAALKCELFRLRGEATVLQVTHDNARRRADDIRAQLAAHCQQRKKGKKQKSNSTQPTKEQMTEKIAELTALMNYSAKRMAETKQAIRDAERQLEEYDRQLEECERLDSQHTQQEEQAVALQKRHQQQLLEQQQQQQHLQQQQQHLQQQQQHLQQQQRQQQPLLDTQRRAQSKPETPKEDAALLERTDGMVRVRRAADGRVAVSVSGCGETTLSALLGSNAPKSEHESASSLNGECRSGDSKKQTWEQALAHINQLAKGSAKEKKKQKQSQQEQPEAKEVRKEQRSHSLPEDQPLSKKQRKLLAKQQMEEEERKRQKEEKKQEKSKKTEVKKAPEAAKPEVVVKKSEKKMEKLEKKLEANKQKEEKKEMKRQEKMADKKAKENKPDKSNAPVASTAKQQPTKLPPQQPPKKEPKKKEAPRPTAVKPTLSVAPETTIQVVNKKKPSTSEQDKPSACSIMEQLSCGIQVADLKLPPGITLTRVQPSDKKETPPIKSVPAWKSSQLAAAPTPVARPPPVINAEPGLMMFSTAHPEPLKTIVLPDPLPQSTAKSKKAKKKAKKAASAESSDSPKQDGPKMVTLRNPMFHPNLPSVQISPAPKAKFEQNQTADAIPTNHCQATITPTSNGMYTIRNPLMSMMHQQSLQSIRGQAPQTNPIYPPSQFAYTNPNVYNPSPQAANAQPVCNSPKNVEQLDLQARLMSLASFTQKQEEGYSLFKTTDDNQQKTFLTPEYYEKPKPVVSPNPIGTRPSNEARTFDSKDSLFANPIQRPEPIGTPLKKEEEKNDFSRGLYMPFGQEDRSLFRNALLFNDRGEQSQNASKMEDSNPNIVMNGDSLPYFQRLRAGSQLNNEVTIHHVTESKFYKGQDLHLNQVDASMQEESIFSRRIPSAWTDTYSTKVVDSNNFLLNNNNQQTNMASAEHPERETEAYQRYSFY